jgi:N-acetylmuramoyl-L-alanine amidase
MGSKPEPETKKLYRVQVGAFKKKGNADNLAKKLKDKGYDVITKKVGELYKVQCGAFSVKKNAQGVYDKLVKDGYKPFITEG